MKKNIWNMNYVCLMIVNTVTSFGFYMISSILSKYLTNIGFDLTVAGVVVGTFSITSLLIRPVTGFLADEYNKKRLIVFACILMCAANFGYIITDHMAVIMISRVIHGIGFGINSTALVSLVAKYIPEEKFGEGMGYFGLGMVLSSAVGPGIGIAVMNRIGIKYSFIVAGLTVFLGIILMAVMKCERGIQRRQHLRDVLKLKRLISFDVLNYTVISGVYSFINGIIASFLVLFAEDIGIKDVSIYFTVYAVVLFIIRPFAGKLLDRRGLSVIIYPAAILTIISMFMLSQATTLAAIVISGVIRAIGQGAAQPSLQAAAIQKAGKERSGVATSTYYLGGDIGQGIGPVLGGVFAQFYGYSSTFYVCIALLVAGGCVFFLSTRNK